MIFRALLLIFFVHDITSYPVPHFETHLVEYVSKSNLGDGSYYFKYVLSDGTEREEKGTVVTGKDNNEYIAVQGFYTYMVDGKRILVRYDADEEGYRPVIDYLDVSPKLPDTTTPISTTVPVYGTTYLSKKERDEIIRKSLLGG